jgi:hypothetical protein
MLLPFIAMALPGIMEKADDTPFHRILFFFVLLLANAAGYNGYRQHKRRRVLGIMFLGVLFLFSGAFYFGGDVITVLGSILMVTAHYLNHKYMKACKNKCCEHA